MKTINSLSGGQILKLYRCNIIQPITIFLALVRTER